MKNSAGEKGLGWVVGSQGLSVLVVSIVMYICFRGDLHQALSVLFGGAATIPATIILAWRIRRSAEIIEAKGRHGMVYLYLAAIERFLYTVLLFALGIIMFKLAILPMIVGLIAGQVGFFLGGLKSQI